VLVVERFAAPHFADGGFFSVHLKGQEHRARGPRAHQHVALVVDGHGDHLLERRDVLEAPQQIAVIGVDGDGRPARQGEDHAQPLVLAQAGRGIPGQIAGAGRFPLGPARELVQRHEGRLRAAGRADHAVAVDQQRLGQRPGDVLAAEGGEDVQSPALATRLGVQAHHVAQRALVVEPVAVDGGGAAGAGGLALPRRAVVHLPAHAAVEIQGRDHGLAVAVPGRVDHAVRNGERGEPVADPARGPDEGRAAVGPPPEQPGLGRAVVAPRAVELGPIGGLVRAGRRPARQRTCQQDCQPPRGPARYPTHAVCSFPGQRGTCRTRNPL